MATKKTSKRDIPTGAPGHPAGSERKAAASGRGARRAVRATREKPSKAGAGMGAGDDERPLPRRRRPTLRGGEVGFLHEDEDIIVVDKPAGLPVIAAEGSRTRTLYDVVTDRIRLHNPKGRAAVVHRLDRDTSGVLVFAKNARAKKTLMDGWDEHAEKRRYVALVEGCPAAASGTMESWLIADGTNRVRVAAAGERGAKLAKTRYRVLGKGAGLGLLELELETGRKHQVRAQLASFGFPVAGDPKYGARADPLGRLGLHASLLELVHPTTGALLRFESPAPPAFAEAIREASPVPRVARAGPHPSPVARTAPQARTPREARRPAAKRDEPAGKHTPAARRVHDGKAGPRAGRPTARRESGAEKREQGRRGGYGAKGGRKPSPRDR